MESKLLIWLKKNYSNVIFGLLVIVLLFSSTAKEFVIKTVASTGLMTSSFEEKPIQNPKNNFSVVAINGKIIEIDDLKGKVVFINFWASWCPPCRAEFPSIQEFYNLYKNNHQIEFLLINMDDDRNKGLEFLKDKNSLLAFYQLGSEVSKDIYDGSLPTTVIMDKNGAIRFRHTGAADFTKSSFLEEINLLLSE